MKNQFQILQPWLTQILHAIKKEIRTEHLSKNPSFYKTYFGARPQNRLTYEEIFPAYEKELLQDNRELGEWVVNRWVFKHGEIYRHFAERLSQIDPDFDAIKSLSEAQSEQILSQALESFGALPTYIFSVLNGVVFPTNVLDRLRAAAEKEDAAQKAEKAETKIQENLEQTVARHQRELSRLHEKYENKIAGVMKKYTTDVNALKKQIRALQQRLNDFNDYSDRFI